ARLLAAREAPQGRLLIDVGDVQVAAHLVDQRVESPSVERRVALLDVPVAVESGSPGTPAGELGLELLQLVVELEHLARRGVVVWSSGSGHLAVLTCVICSSATPP